MGIYGGMRIIQLRNPELLKRDSKILVRGIWGIVIPDGADVLLAEECFFRKSNPIPHIVLDGKEYKWCSWCKKWLRLIEFYKNQRLSDGYDNKCVDCKALYEKKKAGVPRQAGRVKI